MSRSPQMDRFIAWDKNEGHNHGGGAFPSERLQRLEELLPSRLARTAETGCGKSTILFSNLSSSHHVFALDDTGEEDSSVMFYRLNPNTIIANIHEVFGPTQATLFNHQHDDSYDCVLIDGPHGWPFPELEYMLFYPNIRAGGYLILDDVNIPTIGRMADIIAEDAMWHLVEIVGNGTALFQRTETPIFDPHGDGWWLQNYNRRRVSRSRDIYLDDGPHRDQISSLLLDWPIRGRFKARQRLKSVADNTLAIRSIVQRWLREK